MTPGASGIQAYSFAVGMKYVRARISTAFTGGTVQAVLALSQRPLAVPPAATFANSDNVWYQESVTAQAASATVTGSTRDTAAASGNNHRYSAFKAYAFADQSGTVQIMASNDNVTCGWRRWQRRSQPIHPSISRCR